MRVITLNQVKEQLGITDNSQDTAITSKLPIIDAKVKQITNNKYNMQVNITLTNGSNIATIESVNYYNDYRYNNCCTGTNRRYIIETLQEYLMAGDQIEGDGIPTETYIEETYYNGSTITISGTQFTVPAVKLSNNATLDGQQQAFIGINIAYHDIIAKGVQYLINKTSTALPSKEIQSKSFDGASMTYADTKIDRKSGMPTWFVEGLPVYMGGY